MQSASEGSSPQPLRLPVNPRRHKVAPEQRKRVVRACNACNIRRVRCSGENPCQRCVKSSRECEYSAPESDRSALRIDNERLRQRCSMLEAAFLAAAPEEAARLIGQIEHGMPLPQTSRSMSLPPLFNVRETIGSGRIFHEDDDDDHTHSLSENSGATFLEALKDFLHTTTAHLVDDIRGDGPQLAANRDRYLSFDSRPLPDPDVDPFWLPPQAEMAAMLKDLRFMLQDGDGTYPSGGNSYWGDLTSLPTLLTTSASLSTMTTSDTFRNLAFYHAIFALVSISGQPSFEHPERSAEAYFNRARRLLGNPLELVRFSLSDIGALMLMAVYLYETNRRDTSYMYVSTAIHIAIIHEAFSSPCTEPQKRLYWTLYIMDRWYSVLSGRPPTIVDGSMKIPMPCDAESMPSSAGICAHIELAAISSYIITETFKLAPRKSSSVDQAQSIDEALNLLENWRLSLPPTVKVPPDSSVLDPSCYTLTMQHLQDIILITRPFILAAAKQAIARRCGEGQWSFEQYSNINYARVGLEASLESIALARYLRSKRRLLLTLRNYVFNAAVILLLDRIISSNQSFHKDRGSNGSAHSSTLSPEDARVTTGIEFALDVFEVQSARGLNYAKDNLRILRDLKILSDRCMASNRPFRDQEPDFQSMMETWMKDAGEVKLHHRMLI